MKFFSVSNRSVQRFLYTLFQIQRPLFLLFPLFRRISQPSVQEKMLNEHTVNYHPSLSELTSRIYPLIFLCTPKLFISPEYFLNIFENLCIQPWLRKSFKFIVRTRTQVTRTRKYICESKNSICSFLLKQNCPIGSHHHHFKQKDILIYCQ